MFIFAINRRRVSVFSAVIIVFLAGLFPGGAGSATRPTIVYPPDRALLSGDGSLQLLGFLPGGSAGSVQITGKSGSRSQPVGAGSFTVEVKLDPGENSLVLQDRKVTVFLAENAPATIPPGYSPPDTHAVDNGCEECHSFSGGDAKLLEKPPALCMRCHDDVLTGKNGKIFEVLHPPAQEGDCLACHTFHQLAIKRLPAAAKLDLCFGCHDPFPAEEGGKKLVRHNPVEKGECAACHSPHGSAIKKLLLAAPGRGLCLTCHKDPTLAPGGTAWEVPHAALDDGCPSCHLPHVAAAPRLLTKPQLVLCAGCHEDKNLNSEGQVWRSAHAPVVAGLCTSCHGPHGAQEKALLKNSPFEICRTCHTEVHERHQDVDVDPISKQPASGTATLPAGFQVRKKDGMMACIGCHQPHGSDAQMMWNHDETSFCFFCHTQF